MMEEKMSSLGIGTQRGQTPPIMLIAALAAAGALSLATAARADIMHDVRSASGTPMLIGTCFLPSGSGVSGVFFMSGRTPLAVVPFGSPNMTDSHQIFTGPNSDNIRVVRNWTGDSQSPVAGCALFGPLLNNSFVLTVHSEGGNDLVNASGLIVVNSGPGNDMIIAGDAISTSRFSAGDDDDILWSSSGSTQEHLLGEGGNDALCQALGDTGAAVISGGDGASDCTTFKFVSNTDIEVKRRGDCSGRCAL